MTGLQELNSLAQDRSRRCTATHYKTSTGQTGAGPMVHEEEDQDPNENGGAAAAESIGVGSQQGVPFPTEGKFCGRRIFSILWS